MEANCLWARSFLFFALLRGQSFVGYFVLSLSEDPINITDETDSTIHGKCMTSTKNKPRVVAPAIRIQHPVRSRCSAMGTNRTCAVNMSVVIRFDIYGRVSAAFDSSGGMATSSGSLFFLHHETDMICCFTVSHTAKTTTVSVVRAPTPSRAAWSSIASQRRSAAAKCWSVTASISSQADTSS